MKPNILVFDVESTSLHGTGFAVGAIVSSKSGIQLDSFELKSLEGEAKANDFVKQYILPNLKNMPSVNTDRELRDAFFAFYMKHKDKCDTWSDCNFPVETNFLTAIVNDNIQEREFSMPYPLKDISTVVDVFIDRHSDCGAELRKHHPLDDSLASNYFLLKWLNGEQKTINSHYQP